MPIAPISQQPLRPRHLSPSHPACANLPSAKTRGHGILISLWCIVSWSSSDTAHSSSPSQLYGILMWATAVAILLWTRRCSNNQELSHPKSPLHRKRAQAMRPVQGESMCALKLCSDIKRIDLLSSCSITLSSEMTRKGFCRDGPQFLGFQDSGCHGAPSLASAPAFLMR